MIIDCHTHVFPSRMRQDRETLCEKEEGFSSIYRNPKARMADVEELIRSMDECGVDQSVICGFPWTHPDRCALHNDYLLKSRSLYPGRLIVFLSLPFGDPEGSRTTLEEGLKAGAKGVGEVAFYDHAMEDQDIASMKPVLSLMEERRVPLLLHTNETLGHPYPGKGRTPLERIYKFVVSFPRLAIVLAHWGGGLPFYELMPEVAKAMAHVYYDTAASPFLYSRRVYEIVCRIAGPERILFGSDFPLISPRRYFEELKESHLTEEETASILGRNFSAMIGLERPAHP